MSDYSKTPLVKKLGIKAKMKVRFVDAPLDFFDLLELPDIKLLESPSELANYLHIFAYKQAGFTVLLNQSMQEIEQDGMIWVAWQKKSSGIKSDIDGNYIRSVARPMGLTDAKVCSINETWSALKLVIRKELRKKPNNV